MKKSLGAEKYAVPTPAWVIGSYNEAGKPNMMTAAWGGICASSPPSVMVAVQKIRATYDNIMARQAFTINVPSPEHVVAVDYVGIAGGKQADKFAVTGLTAVASELVDAPYVDEFPLVLECRVKQTLEVGSHILFIADIVDVKAEENMLNEQGGLAVDKVNPLTFAPADRSYYELGKKVGDGFSIGLQLKK